MSIKTTYAVRVTLASILLLGSSVCLAEMDSLALPPRAIDSKTGTQLHSTLSAMSRDARENTVYQEVKHGNVPDFLRNMQPVNVSATIDGNLHKAVYYVTAEYVSLGSNDDYYRMPMTPILGQWICDLTSTTMPTRKMVNDIWMAAPCKLSPQPIAPDAQMINEPRFWEHQVMVQTSRNANVLPLGTIVGGHKKDVVITMRLNETTHSSPRVFIYGWHYLSGNAIQPLSAAHESTYADYSHGIRLVNNEMTVDGTTTTVQAILQDPKLHVLLSDEGVYNQKGLAYPVSAPPVSNCEDWMASCTN
ncbi:hypothetical protein GX645_05525 [Candidatus Sumerlaeota bacterium]|nr:hypothetical protein [Candidatus Sumerlaeota bacterium]